MLYRIIRMYFVAAMTLTAVLAYSGNAPAEEAVQPEEAVQAVEAEPAEEAAPAEDAHNIQSASPAPEPGDPLAGLTEDQRKARKRYMDAMVKASHGEMTNYNKVAEALEESIAFDPAYYKAYLLLGKVYTRINKHKESEATIRKAISIEPENPEGYDDLMVLLLYLDRPADAAAVGEDALAHGVNPAYVPDLGWAYYQADMLDKAEVRYTKDLEVNPDSFGPNRNMAILLHVKGEYDKAFS